MKKIHLLFTLFFFGFYHFSFSQDLDQVVTYKATNQSIESILNDLSKSYEINFSYLNNGLPDTKIDVDFEGITLEQALDNVLTPLSLTYIDHNGQIIVKKKPVSQGGQKTIEAPDLDEKIAPEDSSNQVKTEAFLIEQADSVGNVEPSLAEVPISEPEMNEPVYTASTEFTPTISLLGQDSITLEVYETEPTPEPNIVSDTIYPSSNELKHTLFHVGLFYPFSTNGYFAGQYSNKFSAHFIAGYSGGLTGYEMSSITNITNGKVEGLQLAGVTNIVTGTTTGSQIAGVVNLSKDDVIGSQIAGVANVTDQDLLGAQISGLVNVSNGYETGFQASGGFNFAKGSVNFGQIAGFMNVAENLHGPQFAGFMNVQSGHAIGLQVAGFLNNAGDIKGGQVSGFINKAKDVDGTQIAPFVNVARRVKGTQIGLINISEEMDGAPIGFFSVVRRNGYYDLEVFYAEDFQANAIIKLGAKRFHNLFAVSYETDYKNRWAYGYGFGSQWGDRFIRVNTDLLAYYVVEQEFPKGFSSDYELNILTKFRLLGSLHFGSFGIFAGPTFSLMTSRHEDTETGSIGSDIAPETIWEATDGSGTNVKMWIGYNLGIRF
jgi:hypothetical protein